MSDAYKKIDQVHDDIVDEVDQIKYHGYVRTVPDQIEWLEKLGRDVKTALWDWEDGPSQDDVDQAFKDGYDKALVDVTKKILQNGKLKKRGDMIEAVEKLEAP